MELSLDGIHFEPVHKTEGRGNSNVINSYSYNHQYPPQGLLYYRVRQVDFDGKYSYSNIVQVMVAGSASKPSLFPVPAHSFVMVNFGKAILNTGIQVISNDGKIVHNEKLAGLHSQRKISVTGLASGTYIVRLVDGNNVQVLRFIKN